MNESNGSAGLGIYCADRKSAEQLRIDRLVRGWQGTAILLILVMEQEEKRHY
ncbi:hypothetical protein [Kineothrix sp. MB12-C1]|uniref:hypothetical protein n=1 Tax=Kineothrix sp. MB12-C1 TaxID=3070215 RepID=UPI0027D30780|nr:hypothetical protein [Kineothrix sp. MB12-C1]WMC91806.1 hypothetical protein RBB56_13150 [Kineothrix sp. MB12-C1]